MRFSIAFLLILLSGLTSAQTILVNGTPTIFSTNTPTQVYVQPANAYFIGQNASGLFAGNGVQGSPFTMLDGSTRSNFDFNMSAITTGTSNSVITLGSSIFQTTGDLAWNLRQGDSLQGSGMFNTTLQFPASAILSGALSNNALVRVNSGSFGTNTVRDLTLDCNHQPGVSNCVSKGCSLVGDSNVIANVCLINVSDTSASLEAFGLSIFPNPTTGSGNGNLITDYLITNFTGNGLEDLSAVNLNGQNSTVKNGKIYQQGKTNFIFAINISGNNVTALSNYVNGAEIFSYNDSLDGGTNLSYIGNVATNVTQLFDFKSGSYSNLTAMWNSGVLDRAVPSHNGTLVIVQNAGAFTTSMNGFLFASNSFNSTGNTNGVFDVHFATNVTLTANILFPTVPTTLQTNFPNCGLVTYNGNSNFLNQAWP